MHHIGMEHGYRKIIKCSPLVSVMYKNTVGQVLILICLYTRQIVIKHAYILYFLEAYCETQTYVTY